MLCDDIQQQAIDQKLQSLTRSKKGKKRYKSYQDRLQLLKSGKIVDLRVECLACGDMNVRHLQFHHLNPKYKEFTISAATKEQLSRMIKELEKCIVLCANCHLDFHHDVLKIHVNIVDAYGF